MKKLLMTLTLALAAAIAIPSAATAQDTIPANKKECIHNCKECKNKCEKGKKAECKREGKDEKCKADTCKMIKDGKKMHGKHGKGPGMRPGGPMGPGHGNPMMKGITLSDEQQKKLNALMEKAPKPGNMNGAPQSPEEMKKFQEQFEKEIEKILDKDQLKQFKANKEAMEKMRPQR